MPDIYSFGAILDQPTAITALRAAAGIWLPNHNFRDYNATIYSGTKTGGDGLTWNLSPFRDWFYVGSAPNYSQGTAGVQIGVGPFDGISAEMSTSSTDTGESIETDHKVLGQTIYSEFIPFSTRYLSHYSKGITLAIMVRGSAGIVEGTNLKAYLAGYNSVGAHIADIELVFTGSSNLTSSSWSRLLAHTAGGFGSSLKYLQLHIGINSPSGSLVWIDIGDCSLMLNALTNETAVAMTEPFVELTNVSIRRGAMMDWRAQGLMEAQMLDGHVERFNPARDSLKPHLNATFHKVDDGIYQKLISLWSLATRGLGVPVPNPVPLCVDYGLGQLPFFGYCYPVGGTFAGNFHPHWTLANQGYNITMQFAGV